MELSISKILLKNFKAFEEIVIHPNKSFNIIIGENSSGKSTIFEAIHLWERCYHELIQSNKKKFYAVKNESNRHINHQALNFIRVINGQDLLFSGIKNNRINNKKNAEISLVLRTENEEFDLGFQISLPPSIKNLFFRIKPINQSQFDNFANKVNELGKTLDEIIFIYQTRPVAGVHQYEPYYNMAQVKKKLQQGLSHEVLRNKIISKRDNIQNLEHSISEITEKVVKFELPQKSSEKKSEFIDLKVNVDVNNNFPRRGYYDLHLQGSGFLQIAEIISTIEYVDAPLKLLLVDEPDSHIHSKLQKNLISHLKNIQNNQFFIISHNDQFVTNAEDDEVFFLNETSKAEKELKPIPSTSFDIIKKSLGGIILSLDRLNQAKYVVFLEGEDDEEYIKKIIKKASLFFEECNTSDKYVFFFLRGRDCIANKIEYNKRTLSKLFNNKNLGIVFDKDYSTIESDQKLRNILKGKMGNNSFSFSHQGYCIESIIFSDLDILTSILSKNIHEDVNLRENIEFLCDEIKNNISDVRSNLYEDLKSKFQSQKNNRKEIYTFDFDDFVTDLYVNDSFQLERVMSKSIIKKFVLDLEDKIGHSVFFRESNDEIEISSKFFNMYLDSIDNKNDFYDSIISLLKNMDVIKNE